MGFLKRVLGTDRAPEWASYFSGAEYRAFIAAVEADLTRRETPYQLGDGVVHVTFGANEPMPCGLSNLAQMCRTADRADWPTIISRHFDLLATTTEEDDDMSDLAAISHLLKVRIHSTRDYDETVRERLIWAPLAPGLIKVLVFDMPTMVRSVDQLLRQSWNTPDDELFAIGESNVQAERPEPESVSFDAGPGIPIHVLSGESHFVASRLLTYRALGPEGPSHGALVAIPNRHVLIHHHIVDLGVVQAVQRMLDVGHSFFLQGPGSLHDGILWWHDGAITVLPASVGQKGIEFFPPDAFVELLNGLPPPGSSPGMLDG